MRIKRDAIVLAFMLLPMAAAPASPQQSASSTASFGGGFSSLRPQQQRLISDWFKRFSTVMRKSVDPTEGYENLPLSARTTFNAVTHALLMTKLTDDSGKALAESAIDLVDQIDGLAGQVLGEGGDKQFRIYVQMRPDAMKLLGQSKEFDRRADNTVYHKGYPVCFRSSGGTPSIQISLTRDAARADIDVDYRSAKFPLSLVNGHLTASNSDVRVSRNDERHNAQWAGLQNWWRNLLGLPLQETSPTVKVAGRPIADKPRLKDPAPADAIHDFLNVWLVDQKPKEAIAYFDEQAMTCMDVEQGKQMDRGMVKFIMLQGMISANARIGKISSLGEISAGVDITGERLKVIEQPHQSQFALYKIREDLAEEFKCVNKLDSTQISPKAMKSKDFDRYVGAIFRIKSKSGAGNTVATLWEKESGYWQMISYDVDPEFNRGRTPNVGTPIPTQAELKYVEGDKEMTEAAADFLKQWLVKKNVDKALEYFTPECLACVNLYSVDDVPAPTTNEGMRELLKTGLARAAAGAGSVKNLADAIVAPEAHHQDLRLVKHRDAKAFVIASIPEYMADAASCVRREQDGEPNFSAKEAAGYGKYYATGFSLSSIAAHPGVLWMVWAKMNNSWKIASYVLLTP